MFTKISITLKISGKVIEVFTEGEYDREKLLHHGEWVTVEGYELHPFKSPKTVIIDKESIGAIELQIAEDWTAESAKEFKNSLS